MGFRPPFSGGGGGGAVSSVSGTGGVNASPGTGAVVVSLDTTTAPAIAQQAPYTCPSGTAVNDVVYVSGASTVTKADATTTATGPAVGVVVSKPTSTSCIVQFGNEVGGFVGLTPGTPYYVSTTPGGLVATPATASGNYRQLVGIAKTATILVVRPSPNIEAVF